MDCQSDIINMFGIPQNLQVPIKTFKTYSKALHRIVSNHDHLINHFEVSDRKSDATMMTRAINLAKGVDLIELDRSKLMKSQGSLLNYDAP